MSFYELFFYLVNVFSIESFSHSDRKIRTKNNTFTLKNLRRDDLISHRDSNVNQFENRIFKLNKNLLLLKENLQKMWIENILKHKFVFVLNILHTQYRLHDDKTSKRDNI